jgi:broad specificity phosphatase PhoE
MTLLFLRHGETDWNAQGLIQGRTDIPLNETGRAQARERAAELVAHRPPVDVIYASPLKRARETAEIIQQALGAPLYFDDRLMEQCFGRLEGVPRTRLAGGSVFGHWDALGEAEFLRQGAETFPALYERAGDFLEEIGEKHAGQTVLVVAHGCVGRMVHWYFHGRDETDAAKHGNAVLRRYDEKLAGERPAFTG